MEIILLMILTNLSTVLNKKTLKIFLLIIDAIFSMKGRITMLGIARWSDGCSYKTIERFFDKKMNWLTIKWEFVKNLIQNKEIILVADETVVSKSGKNTNGLSYFFSSMANRRIKAISFITFSLVSIEDKRAFPIFTKQIEKNKISKNNINETKKVKKTRGRPKGKKEVHQKDVKLNGIFRMVNLYLKVIINTLKIVNLKYFVYDGAFGNNTGIKAVLQRNLHLISKLKNNSGLYLQYDGVQKNRGRKRIYGEKVDYSKIDDKYLIEEIIDDNKIIKNYQFKALSKTINQLLNIIIIQAYNTKTLKTDHKILFSTDIELEAKKIIEYYSLRFQIEFNFRDSKQFFSLEDFMNIKKRRIHNFANLSLFMNNVAYVYAKQEGIKVGSVND